MGIREHTNHRRGDEFLPRLSMAMTEGDRANERKKRERALLRPRFLLNYWQR